MKATLWLLATVLVAIECAPLTAQTNGSARAEFSLQGRLMTSGGTPVADGTHNLRLAVYMRGNTTPIHTETDVVTTVNGIFSTMVGDSVSGSGSGSLQIDASADYDLGVTVDNDTEMQPRIRLAGVLRSAVADLAADAEAVGGFMVDTTGARANALVTTDVNGRLRSSLLGSSTVTSVNGLRGDVNFEVSGSGVSVDTMGGVLRLNVTGGGGGDFSLPFSSPLLQLANGDAFRITNSLAGNAGAFINTGLGTALRAQSTTGAAIRATSNGSLTGSATITAENTAGTALEAMGNVTADAVLRVKNTAAAGSGRLISALDAGGNAVFEIGSNGATRVRSSVANALDVATTATGEAAMKIDGGLTLNGPVGTGTINLATGQTVISNVYARANSVIMVTITSATGVTVPVPIQVASQGTGTFTVASVVGNVASLTGTYTFNYLIINR